MEETLAIFADPYWACTGFAVVCSNLARELSRWFRIVYFARFGRDKEFDTETSLHPTYPFETVNCQGGVWDRELMVRILKHYSDINYVFSEDDWYSAEGLIHGTSFWDKPFHFMCAIDSLPVDYRAFHDVFANCDKVYIPNRSYLLYDGHKRHANVNAGVRKRFGNTLHAVYAPHSARADEFYNKSVDRDNRFTFVWSGRDEPRKAMHRFLLAFEKVAEKTDAQAFIRSDWSVNRATQSLYWIKKKNLPVILDQMSDCPHEDLVNLYNRGDVYVSTAMAGACEMGVMEAMACEKPALVTDFTFMNESVVDGKSGFLIPISGMRKSSYGSWWGECSVDALAEKMMWCYEHPEQVKYMGKWARDYVIEKYNWRNTAERIKDEILNVG